jgi:hypothetical protein
VAYLVGVIMALGALFGSVKILHATVDSRVREIATLRAIGYGGLAVATAVVLEAVILSLLGALVGAWIARVVFDGRVEAIFNAVFTLSVSARLIALGMGWALLLAVLGGLAPAIRSARLPVAAALQRRDAVEPVGWGPRSGAREAGLLTGKPLPEAHGTAPGGSVMGAWNAVIRAGWGCVARPRAS